LLPQIYQPSAPPKGRGVNATVAEINNHWNKTSGQLVFDPSMSVKTILEWFEFVMKIVKDLNGNVPFQAAMSMKKLIQILEDLYEEKTTINSLHLYLTTYNDLY
jgi:hypothetical protein